MAAPRVFVSSTAYDLGVVRSQLRSAILELGYEPILSEYADVLYDHRQHTTTSCVTELATCDLVVLIVGSRFGNEVTPAALANIDLANVGKLTSDSAFLDGGCISVTQLELLKAMEAGLPVYAFVDERVLQDHATYVANRDKPFVDQIQFSSISQPGFARYIFSFIDFLHHRFVNNSITGFSRVDDIENHLRRQWAALFQRFLQESREVMRESTRSESIEEKLDDLRAAILSSIGDASAREIAKGSVKYRYLLDVLRGLRIPNLRAAVESAIDWEALMTSAGVVAIHPASMEDESQAVFARPIIEKSDGTLLRCGFPYRRFQTLTSEWEAYCRMSSPTRMAIFDGLDEAREGMGHQQFFRPYSGEKDPVSGLILPPKESKRSILDDVDVAFF